MFEDVELYLRDLKKYYEDVQELNSEGLDLEDKKRKELDDKFKDKLRKYLPSSLNIINTTFDCKFSLYKEGQDLDAKLNVINTKVKKTKEEIATTLMSLRKNGDISKLSEKDLRQLNLATEIINVYSDDQFASNMNHSMFLKEALSLVDQVNPFDDNSVQEQPNIVTTSEVQFNPYAGQPVDLTNDYSKSIDSNNFNNITTNSATIQTLNTESDNNYASKDMIDVNSLSIFGSNPNVNNNQNNQ